MGSDFGQWTEWDSENNLQWDLLQWETHKGLQACVADLNRLCRENPALYEQDFKPEGFEWIDCNDYDSSTLTYLRRGKDPEDFLVICCNFTPIVRDGYRLGVPKTGWYKEIFNSDSTYYAGSNVGNGPGVKAQNAPSHGRKYSIEVTLPPLAVTVFKPSDSI
jgi:1,4-alpha-glucan branching enzyme